MFKVAALFFVLALFAANLNAQPLTYHQLWPVPVIYQAQGTTNFTIQNPCNFTYVVVSNNAVPQLQQMVSLYQGYMFSCGTDRPGNEIVLQNLDIDSIDLSNNNVLLINITSTANILLTLETDESYNLTISGSNFLLSANSYAGFLRGLDTFSQIVTAVPGSNGSTTYVLPFGPIYIRDYPRFPHRGVMIDTARHFITTDNIMTILDGMLFTKLNVLHWHITDSDSFPIQSLSHPNLTLYGAFSPEEVYSASDVAELVDYAIARGIMIIPEIDSPAHVTSWSYAPEARSLINCSQDVWYQGIPFGQINPTLNATYELVGDILGDLQTYFPWEFIHLGADEVFQWCWDNTEILEWAAAHDMNDYSDLFNYYVKTQRSLVPNRTAIYWGSNATEFLKFENGDVIQYWGASADFMQYANSYPNNKFVLSNYDTLYIDCGLGNYFGQSCFCNPFPTWLQMYQWDPVNFVKANTMSRILGAEAVEWSELNNNANIVTKIFPRATSLAEKLWTPYVNQYNNILSVFERLNTWRDRALARGVPSMPISAEYCELNPQTCFVNSNYDVLIDSYIEDFLG